MSFRKGGTRNLGEGASLTCQWDSASECNSEDYLIGCGLGFRIRVSICPKPGLRGFQEGEGALHCVPQGLPPGPNPLLGLLNSLSAQEPWSVSASPHPPACAIAESGERKLVHSAEHLSPVPDKETAVCGTRGLRGDWG